MIEEALYIAAAIAIVIAIRSLMPKKKTEQYEDILNSPEYKVKGKFET